MTDPNLRCQVAKAMVAALPPLLDSTCISDIATDMAGVMISTAAELVLLSKHPREAQGYCAGPDVEAEMNAAWQHIEEARRYLRVQNFTTAIFERPCRWLERILERCARLPF